MQRDDDLDSELMRHQRIDVDKLVDRQEAIGGAPAGGAGARQEPVSSSWLTWHVKLPSRVALLTMACIFVYEVLVGVSMGVRVVRFVMVSWLGWLLLAVNVGLLLLLGGIVLYHKVDWGALRYRRSTETAESKTFDE